MTTQNKLVLALVRDLFFGVRLSDTVRSLGHEFKRVDTPAALLSELDSCEPGLVIVDLGGNTGALSEIARRARGARLVAFGPHVDTDSRRAAKEAGFDEVVTNGRLARDLSGLLSRNLPSGDVVDAAEG